MRAPAGALARAATPFPHCAARSTLGATLFRSVPTSSPRLPSPPTASNKIKFNTSINNIKLNIKIKLKIKFESLPLAKPSPPVQALHTDAHLLHCTCTANCTAPDLHCT